MFRSIDFDDVYRPLSCRLMSLDQAPIGVVAFEAANSRAYLSEVFASWSEGACVMAGSYEAPGIDVLRRTSFTPDPGWFEADLPARPDDERALIAFSSGTTGAPKAILLQHRSLTDVVGRINGAMQVTEEIREYLGVPVTFSFGFGRARAVAAAGGRAFLPEHGFDPAEIGRMLEQKDINAVSAVPTLWRVLLANKSIISPNAARNLRWIEIGSQWMTGAEKLDLRRLFPNALIVQHYGLTEASRSTLLDITHAPEDRLDSVGRAEGKVRIGTDDEGRIRVTGPHLAEGLIRESGVETITDEDGWLTTSDRGRIEDGWLYYEGRVDELINVGGVKIDPTAFEQAINSALGVPGAVAAGRLSDPLRGEKVLVALDRSSALDRARVTQAIEVEANRRGLTGSGSFELRTVENIPVTATGKVRRSALPDLPGLDTPQRRDTATAPVSAGEDDLARLQTLWGEILGLADVPTDKSFYDLGGDSLSALTTILRMEKLGIEPETARGIFEGRTIADLANTGQSAVATDDLTEKGGLALGEMVNAVHATRGVLVFWVVMIHWLPGLLRRLGDDMTAFYQFMTPAWRFGTPGFALVFGIGLGALGWHRYRTNTALFLKSNWRNALLVLTGVLLLGVANFAVAVVGDTIDNRLVRSGLFYSVLTYYALALLTLPVMMRLLAIGPNRVLSILAIGAAALLIHTILHAWISHLSPPAFLEFLKIALVAKYGFFRMTSYVMIGALIGYLFRAHHDKPGIAGQLVGFALVMIGFGALGLYQAAPDDIRASFNFPQLWHVAIYAGVAMLILAGFSRMNLDGGPDSRWVRRLNAFLVATGILALPIFVGHELLGALKALLDLYGIPDAVGLMGLLGVFGAIFAVLYIRLMRFLS